MKTLHLRVIWVIVLILMLEISVCCALGKVLNNSDLIVKHIPSARQFKIGDALKWKDQNSQVNYEQECIVSLTVYSEEYSTCRGVKVGDTSGAIIRLYGEPARFGESDDYKWFTYYFESQDSSFKIHFYFDKENETIIAINFNLYPVIAPPKIIQSI